MLQIKMSADPSRLCLLTAPKNDSCVTTLAGNQYFIFASERNDKKPSWLTSNMQAFEAGEKDGKNTFWWKCFQTPFLEGL